MKQATLTLLEKSSAALTVSTGAATSATKYSGWLDYLDVHAAGIGVLLTVFFGIGYLTFHFLSLKKQTLAQKDKARIDALSSAFNEHQKDTSKEFDKVNSKLVHIDKGMQDILSKLNKGK